jgi:manganese-dependent inorganic pyrophosphatase
MGPTLVFGHRNPDNDSICSAVAYAHLKNVTDPDHVYVAGRLGPMPPETVWVFERFGVDAPDEVEHVRMRAADAMTADVVTVAPETTLLEAGTLMGERGIRALPVVEDGVPRGLLTTESLANRFLEDHSMRGFAARPTTVARLAAALDAEIAVGDGDRVLEGNVLIGAMEPETMRGYLREGDTLIVGDRRRTQPMALDAGIACLVVTGGTRPDGGVLELAEEKGAAVLVTGHDSYSAGRIVDLGQAVGDVMEADVVRVEPHTLLAEVAEDLFASTHREALVVGADGELAGLVTRTDLARAPRRRVVLVDHNEVAQSADGIEEADVVEIVDHHRIGDVETAGPATFVNLPVGSTATVVALRYRELDEDVPHAVAGLLLSAILSDTVLLKSPTTTEQDREVVGWLAREVDADPTEFGIAMLASRTTGETFSVERAVGGDLKEYRFGETSVAIGQLETVDATAVLEHREELLEHMRALADARGYDLALLMVTDVLREGSEVLAAGRKRFAERALDVDLASGSAWMPGVLSRKKQVAAELGRAAV